jgi:N-acetylmuramoyl-L-alanine amidase
MTPTPTATATATATATNTPTMTPTPTYTATPTTTPTNTATPTPSATPTLIQPLPPTSTPTPAYAQPTATPAAEARAPLLLAMPPYSDMLGASATFDAVRRRGIRTLSFLSLENHVDFVRLSIADGHLPGLYLAAGEGPIARAAEWEALLTRLQGAVTHRLAMAEEESAASALEALGYTVIRPQDQVSGIPGQPVRLVLDAGGAQRAANLAYAAAQQGLGLGSHPIAEVANAVSFQRPPPATTLAEFQERHLVILDPGHTRADNGTPIYPPVGRAVLERWAVLVRAYAWQELLEAEGWTVVLTHDDDSRFDEYSRTPDTVNDGQRSRRDDLQYRANLCYYLGVRTGRTPVVVSLHVDSIANPAIVGPLTFYAAHGDRALIAAGKQLAEEMHSALVRFWADQEIDAPGRGVLHADTYAWDRMAEAGYTTIGNRFTLTAPGATVLPTDVYVAVLIEAGMATHPEEAQVLATEEGNVLLAQVHHQAWTRWVEWMLTHDAALREVP